MDEERLVLVEHVSKAFAPRLPQALRYGLADIGRDLLGMARDRHVLRPGEFWAVQDLSLTLGRGECVALIGRNGAGKSTVLKLLCGLVKPTAGRIEVRGRVGALISLGVGLNPALTGRENVLVLAAIHGLSAAQARARLDAVVAFAELDSFIDAPVQSYSSGMAMRLGFAVAAQLEPDVLLIDEVLAVGDAAFRAKCYNRIAELAARTAIVFVSHSMSQVARVARRAIVLHRGNPVFDGAVADAVQRYQDLFDAEERGRFGSGEARVEAAILMDERGSAADTFDCDAPVSIRLRVRAERRLDDVVIDLVLRSAAGEVVAECNNYVRSHRLSLPEGASEVNVEVDHLRLNPGRYHLSTLVLSADMTRHYDWLWTAASFAVVGGRPATAAYQLAGSWRID